MMEDKYGQQVEKKMEKYEFWEKVLNSARYVVAPMVDQSELAWRMLSRKYGAQLCYSPMLHASVFIRDEGYRKEALQSCPEDRPLIIQFCANDPNIFVEAAKLAQDHADAIDLNLGCPQCIAKRGHYGAFLQDDWDLIHKMLSHASKSLKVPVTCKIRVFKDLEKTVKYAKMLEKTGISLITVHGRTRDMKGATTGLADWNYIKAVKQNVYIPVFANGNIQYLSDVKQCMDETGADGVMSAEGNLHNPALFSGIQPLVSDISEQYLELVKKYPCGLSSVRGHMFKLWHHMLQVHIDLRLDLAKAKNLGAIIELCAEMKKRCEEDMKQHDGTLNKKLPHPYWVCQPYVRPSPEEAVKAKEKQKAVKRPLVSILEQDKNTEGLSKNQMKKRMRNPSMKFRTEDERRAMKERYIKCANCGNPKGLKCVFGLCRACCKSKAHKLMADCPSHNLCFKTKHEKRLKWEEEQRKKQKVESLLPEENALQVTSTTPKESEIDEKVEEAAI
ncbi:tRNA-dihydrouridine(16/17) synthase [NAD(P)(+)]-like [Ptychodera flava]|uniref:tRNA-dihydrouridine(16/17) synthase [NAD(P)(+)]-like n=1 Tax=Ptychodera flava TaxID=63121 RepID=UPI00396A5C54